MATASPYCPGCFRPKTPGVEMCPHCGYDESDERKPSLLRHWTRLQGGKYVLGRVLGEGGFGITYLAMETRLKVPVAIKELFPRDMAERGRDGVTVVSGSGSGRNGDFRYALDRFLDEARTVAGFNHPNLVRVREFFEENGTGYIVMDYYSGGPLDALLKRQFANRPMPEATALGVMRPVLEGLAVVHAKGWLHRDIKPANIYLADWRQPVLLDFGAARMAVGEKSKSWSVILTPGYAPAEQYSSKGRNQGPWTDIYACAAVLYRMLSGETPPDAPALQQGEERLRPLAETRRDIRPEVAAAVERAMSVAIEDRPQDIAEFLRLLDGQGGVPPRRKRTASTPVRAGRGRGLALGLAGLALLAFLGGGLVLGRKLLNPPPPPVASSEQPPAQATLTGEPLDAWIGEHLITEVDEYGNEYPWSITISAEEGRHIARIAITGIQRAEYMRALVSGDAREAKLSYWEHVDENGQPEKREVETYDFREHLVTLQRINGQVVPLWPRPVEYTCAVDHRGTSYGTITVTATDEEHAFMKASDQYDREVQAEQRPWVAPHREMNFHCLRKNDP